MAKTKRQRGLPDVSFVTTDGNIRGRTLGTSEQVSALLFDISTQPDLFKSGYGQENKENLNEGDICVLFTPEDMETFGIIERQEVPEGQEDSDVNLLYGIPHYHISEFYRARKNNEGELYVMFADCSKDWEAITVLQNATGGLAHQIGVYTEQSLWDKEGNEDGTYSLKIVEALSNKAKELEDEHAPTVILLQANTASLGGAADTEVKQIDLSLIPDAVTDKRHIALFLGQANHSTVNEMQLANKTNAPVGCIGAALGSVSYAYVNESIGWVSKFNLFGEEFQRVELGFGNTNIEDGQFISTNKLESIPKRVLDNLADKGYNFPIKYAGEPNGIHFCFDQTLAVGDFDTISNNRTIHKSRRLVRQALIPQLHSPVLVSLTDGTLTQTKITELTNVVSRAISTMESNGEISGKKIYIDPKQKVLVDDKIVIEYGIVPTGKLIYIEVEEGLSTTTR